MKTIIEFLSIDGKKPVLELIRKIGADGKLDAGMMQLYQLILMGMDYLRLDGLQEAYTQYFKTHLEDGRPYTIMLVKVLRDHKPMMEFRINWRGTGAFRAIFFEYRHRDKQILVFARATIKQTTFDSNFESMVREAKADALMFRANPEKYINLSGDE